MPILSKFLDLVRNDRFVPCRGNYHTKGLSDYLEMHISRGALAAGFCTVRGQFRGRQGLVSEEGRAVGIRSQE